MTLLDSSYANQFDKQPPHSVQAEMCLLGALMLDKEHIGDVSQVVDKDSFFETDHQILYEVIIRLYDQGKSIDAVIVGEELIKRGLYEEVGGRDFLAKILNSIPSSAHAMHYATIVREKSMLRRLIAASNQILREAYAPQENADSIVDRAERRIFDIAQVKVTGKPQHLGDIAMEVYDQLENHTQSGVLTGFTELDDKLHGLQPGEMIIIAARPSMGKTAFAMNIVENVSANLKLPSAVFSLEMSKQQLVQRLLCSRAGIDSQRVRKGMIGAADYQKLAAVSNELAKAPVWIDDSSGMTILELRAKARRLKAEHNIELLVIDYMQLMDNPGPESRQQQISEISRGIKSVARELRIPVVALSQLNRASEGRDGHRPRMSDLRESGSIEQDADVVMLLHREDYYKQNEPDFIPENTAEVIIAKQRNGPTGTVKMTFDNRTTTFRNYAAQFDSF